MCFTSGEFPICDLPGFFLFPVIVFSIQMVEKEEDEEQSSKLTHEAGGLRLTTLSPCLGFLCSECARVLMCPDDILWVSPGLSAWPPH